MKSLIFGSMAALVAVTGARAADPVMVEPEPIEYVQVCDAYGAGFFYIPGTETCLKISGYARVEYLDSKIDFFGETIEAHDLYYRGRLNFDARNETSFGTLRSQIRLQGDGSSSSFETEGENPNDAPIGIDRLLISLAGFRLGYSDDYWSTVGGYGYYKAAYDGNYGYNQGMFVDYTYAADGFTATFGAVDDRRSGTAGQPDFYAGTTYSGSWGKIFGTYHHDSSVEEGAFKIGAEYDFDDTAAIKAWFMADDGKTAYVGGQVWAATAKFNISDNVTIFGGYSNYECELDVCEVYDISGYDFTVGVRWTIADGLYVMPEYVRAELDHYDVSSDSINIRVVRSF
jgi:hypothetical protein